MYCKICGASISPLGTYKIMGGKYNVRWFRCQACGFTQTEEPFWLEEAYSRPVNISDVGAVNRNIMNARLAMAVVMFFFDSNGSFIDYGGGYGLFVRIMRDIGFDFYRYDKYCRNIFAEGFDKDESPDANFELATAFEVLEHFANPLIDIEGLLELSSNIFFSTTLLPENNPKPGEWWYYGLEHGQHIALYTKESLRSLAEQKRLKFYSNGLNYHLFTRKKIPPCFFKIACNPKVAKLVNILFKRKSLIADDYEKVTGGKLH